MRRLVYQFQGNNDLVQRIKHEFILIYKQKTKNMFANVIQSIRKYFN